MEDFLTLETMEIFFYLMKSKIFSANGLMIISESK